MFGDLTVTSGGDARIAAPVVKSASYNFAAGDVAAWVYIASGTNWTPGWYKIASVASNEATLSAAIGAGVLMSGTAVWKPTTAAGVATVQTPTSGTWTIDFSQQAAARYAYTDLASVGAGLTVSSAAKPFAKEQVGNSLVITGGTNFTTGRWVIASVAAAVATLVGPANVTTGAGVSGTGGQGGALASPGQVGVMKVAGNDVFIASGTYTLTGSTANLALGPVNDTTGGVNGSNTSSWEGYNTVRGDKGTRPVISAGSIGTITIVNLNTVYHVWDNIDIDGNGQTATIGVKLVGAAGKIMRCKASTCTSRGIQLLSQSMAYRCEATACSGTAAFDLGSNCQAIDCEAYANTIHGFFSSAATTCINCIASSNTGTTDGFKASSNCCVYINCVSYGNGQHGFNFSSATQNAALLKNCIAEANTGTGFIPASSVQLLEMKNCGYYNNGTNVSANILFNNNPQLATGSFFTNPGSGDFSLNNTASQGALARGAGYPGLMPRGLTTGYLDIGVAQHADPTPPIGRRTMAASIGTY